MSEEVVGAIKFQHQNLLHLVDYLRAKIGPLTTALANARDALQQRRNDEMFSLLTIQTFMWI